MISRAEKAERIMQILDELYPLPEIPLDHEDPFTLLVAVVLSAQTTDKKVNEVTPRLFAVARTPEEMSEMTVAEIHKIIRELGLAPQKAKALRGLAEKLVAEHQSKVPTTFEELIELPGVGRKTANVVLAQAFGRPTFPVDTHIHRLAERWGLSKGKSPDHTEMDLRRTFPESAWNRLHLQIIYFGRQHCPALRHDPAACKICSWAMAKRRRGSDGASVDHANRRARRSTGTRSTGSRAGKRRGARLG